MKRYWLVETYDGEYNGEWVIRADIVEMLPGGQGIKVNGAILLVDEIVSVREVSKKTALNHANWYGKEKLNED